MDKAIINRMKHFETFYEQLPPGMVKEREEAPEECIPDTEGNRAAREFLANAPKKGLWMPLGKEVKVMQCWRCKNYGHRTGDRECPLFKAGNAEIEKFRAAHEDPMFGLISQSTPEQENKLRFLQQVLEGSSSEGSSSEDEDRRKRKRKKKKEKWIEKDSPDKPSTSKKKKKKKEKDHASAHKHKRKLESDSSDNKDLDNKHKHKSHKLKKHKTPKKKHRS